MHTLDDFAAEAQRLADQFRFAAPLRAQVQGFGTTAGLRYTATAWLPQPATDEGDCGEYILAQSGICPTPEAALAAFAAALDVPNPFAVPVLATAAQRTEILRLLDLARLSPGDKTRHLLRLNRYTAAEADAALAQLGARLEAREGAEYAVVAEAFTVDFNYASL
ncbi:MAG: hypothetical protein NVS3B25_07150 [Hymenobacter sp.]